MHFLWLILVLWVAAGSAAEVPAGDDPRARAILDRAAESSRTSRRWSDREQTLALQIFDRNGGLRERRLQMWTKRYDDEASRTMLVFREPPQASGVGFLQWVDPRGPDRQWLYTPSTKRVRQISGSRRRDSFVGTDFSYEDLGLMMDVLNWPASDARSRLIEESSALGEVAAAIVEVVPAAAQEVSYASLRLWVGRDDDMIHRFDFIDRKGQQAKTLVLSDFRDVVGIPAPHRMEMIDARAGSRTVATVESLRFNVGMEEELFTKRRLERGG